MKVSRTWNAPINRKLTKFTQMRLIIGLAIAIIIVIIVVSIVKATHH